MSEEKLYAVKNDDGEYLTVERTAPWWNSPVGTAVRNIDVALAWAEKYGGHVVTFVEEPEKVVVSESIGRTIDSLINADNYVQAAEAFHCLFASVKNKDFKRTMKAVRNGYTVAKEKKWRLPVPSAWCGDSNHYWHKESDGTLTWSILAGRSEDFEFSRNEIAEYGMNGFKKEEVTDDDD